ncbi:MAG: glycosyltransferase family 39 protein [Bryobacteraceae bacterium]
MASSLGFRSQESGLLASIRELSSRNSRFREPVVVGAIVLMAAALRLYHVGAISLEGDEYHSIQEAHRIGQNPGSIPYFWILRSWMHFGDSDAWLRLPAVFMGTLVIPVIYLLGKEMFQSSAGGALAALLNATSAYAVEYSQQVRFYALFLLASCVAFLAFVRYLRRRNQGCLWLLVAADAFCVASHALGFVVILVQLAFIGWGYRAGRIILVSAFLGLFACVGLAEFRPQWFAVPFHWLARYQGTLRPAPYPGPRGIRLSTPAKIPLSLYFFLFGESVYPGTFWFVVPSVSVFTFLVVRGFAELRRRSGFFGLIGVWTVGPMLLLFLCFDVIAPRSFVGASSRYIIYVMVAVQIVISAGIMSLNRSRALIRGACFLITAVSLIAYYRHSWRPWTGGEGLGDWRTVTRYVEKQWGSADSLILYDSPSAAAVLRYFPARMRREPLCADVNGGSLERLLDRDQIFVISNNDGEWDCASRFLKSVQYRFITADTYVKYPRFVFDLRRADDNGPRAPVKAAIPVEPYGLQFADLDLPAIVRFEGKPLRIIGGFRMPAAHGGREQVITMRANGTRLTVFSSLVNAGDTAAGAAVAELIVKESNGQRRSFLVRQGIETNDWSQPCPKVGLAGRACAVVDSWNKKVALLGWRAYPGAWRQFEAHIFAAGFQFDAPLAIDEISVHYLVDRGYLEIWGLYVTD